MKSCRWISALLLMTLAVAMLPAAYAETQYIFPDSNRRQLTWEEVEAWNVEALNIGFNEIWARHGYVFRAGGACYRWFSRQDWYHPITSGDNEHDVLPKASKLEWENYRLIRNVMNYKRAYGLENDGKKLPALPKDIDLLSGFEYVSLKTGQTLPVYSAPTASSWRGANGRAAISTTGRVYAYGTENNWLMVMYETNASRNAVRVGWIDLSQVSGSIPALPQASFVGTPVTLGQTAQVTDDPVGMTAMATLTTGTQVTWLGSFYSSEHLWDYIEFNLNGQRARGFVLSGAMAVEDTGLDSWDEEYNG